MGIETDGVSPRIVNMYLMKEAKYIDVTIYICKITSREDLLCLVPDAEARHARSPSRELQISGNFNTRYHLRQLNFKLSYNITHSSPPRSISRSGTQPCLFPNSVPFLPFL